jgi:hypothetical protein
MRLNIVDEGKRAWYNGDGFIANPYHIWYQEEEYTSWSHGWWAIQYEMEEKDREVLRAELEAEARAEEAEWIVKDKKKTKRGRAELAGQSTLF